MDRRPDGWPCSVQYLSLTATFKAALCAEEGSRTPTPNWADGFEPSAYTIPPPRQGLTDSATTWCQG